ncbi:MAG: DUF4333 domain-containing protein [Polyangiaceae bacterium]
MNLKMPTSRLAVPSKLRALLAPLALLALPLAGCGVDDATLKEEMKKMIESKFTGAKVEGIECPAKHSSKKGDTFDCTAKLGASGEMVIQVTNTDEGVKMESKYKYASPDDLKKNNLDCGTKFVEYKSGNKYSCSVGGVKMKMTIDDKGEPQMTPEEGAASSAAPAAGSADHGAPSE